MKRREFIAGLLVAATFGQARAQQPAKVHRIAIVTLAFPIAEITETSSFLPEARTFFRELRRFGYIEGRNLIVERYSVERPTVELARDVLRSKPDVILSLTWQWTVFLKPLTTITIVGLLADPVGFGLITSLAYPGGNITGIYILNTAVIGKRLELLRELAPTARVIGYLANPKNAATTPVETEELRAAARALGVELRVLNATDESEIDTAFVTSAKERSVPLVVSTDNFFMDRPVPLVALAARHAIPAIYPYRWFPTAGGLMSYGVDLSDVYRQVGIYEEARQPFGLVFLETHRISPS